MMDDALRRWAAAETGRWQGGGDGDGRDRAEQLLRHALAERPDDRPIATMLASLLIRRASAYAQGQWAWTTDWFEDHPLAWGEDPDGEELDGNLWANVEARHAEAGRLLRDVLRAAPGDMVATLVLGALWLDRRDLYRMLADQLPAGDPRMETLARQLAQEGSELGRQAYQVCPANPLSLHLLREGLAGDGTTEEPAAGGDGYGWYVVRRDFPWSNRGELNTTYLVSADPAAVRQAAELIPPPDPSLRATAEFTLTVYEAGQPHSTVDLAGSRLVVPELRSEQLPFGMPVLDRDAMVLHHGYSTALW